MAYTEFGLWLDRKMREAGITSQSELGRRVGRSHAAVNRWMNGVAEPTDRDVKRLCQVLGTSELEAYQALGKLPRLREDEWPEWRERLAKLNPVERKRLAAIADALLRGQNGS